MIICLCGKEYQDYMANLVCRKCKQFIPDGEWKHDKKVKEELE